MKIKIYTKTNCPNCVAAKNLLKSKNIGFWAKDVSDDAERNRFSQKHPQIKQMPAIFIDDQYVGGLAGLQAALKQVGL